MSPINTYKYQASLPRLPIPELDSSLNKYLLSVKPLLNASDYATTSGSPPIFLFPLLMPR